MTKTLTGKQRLGKRVALALTLAFAFVPAFAGVAQADAWHDHEVRGHRYWHHPRIVEEPRAVYAPPVVYAPPPPQPEGINLIVPLHFN